MGVADAIGNFIGDNIGTGAQLYGQQNAGEALTKAAGAASDTQKQYLQTAKGYYDPYTSMGSDAAGALDKAQGAGGGKPDYSGFMDMPGYQFAIQQGQQAAMRQAAAMGNAGNSGTSAMIGNQVAGTAMQDYNTYIQQLQASAGIGQTAANQIGNLTYNTGANISQLQENAGQAQAGLYTGMGETAGYALGGPGGGYYSGNNKSGAGSAIGGLIGKGLGAIGGWLGGGNGGGDSGGGGIPSAPNFNFDDNSWMNGGGSSWSAPGGMDDSSLFGGQGLTGSDPWGGGFST